MSLRESPGEAEAPRVGVGRHPAGAGDAEGDAAHAGVGRLRASPGPAPAQTGRLGVSHQTQTQTGIRRLWGLFDVFEFYTWTGRFMALNTWLAWLAGARIVFWFPIFPGAAVRQDIIVFVTLSLLSLLSPA